MVGEVVYLTGATEETGDEVFSRSVKRRQGVDVADHVLDLTGTSTSPPSSSKAKRSRVVDEVEEPELRVQALNSQLAAGRLRPPGVLRGCDGTSWSGDAGGEAAG